MSADRYLRHSLIDWFDQQALRDVRVIVVGAGAIGNEVVKNLALLGVGAIHIIDFDTIEIHNLTRSVLFSEGDVGKKKAEVAADAARRLDPNCRVTSCHGDFWKVTRFEELRNASAVFCCVDNFDARFRLNRLCRMLRIDLVNTGIDSRYASAEFFPFSRQADCACYECGVPPTAYQRVAERFSCGWLRRAAFVERKVPTTTITASIAGAISTSAYLHSLKAPTVEAYRVLLDTINFSMSRSLIPRADLCAGCSEALPAIVFAAKASESAQSLISSLESDVEVTLSDPILVRWEAPNCRECVLREFPDLMCLAIDASDKDTLCNQCERNELRPIIRQQFSLRELRQLFGGREIPAKYLKFEQEGEVAIVELI